MVHKTIMIYNIDLLTSVIPDLKTTSSFNRVYEKESLRNNEGNKAKAFLGILPRFL